MNERLNMYSKEAEELQKAWREFVLVLRQETKIDKILEWLSKKLK